MMDTGEVAQIRPAPLASNRPERRRQPEQHFWCAFPVIDFIVLDSRDSASTGRYDVDDVARGGRRPSERRQVSRTWRRQTTARIISDMIPHGIIIIIIIIIFVYELVRLVVGAIVVCVCVCAAVWGRTSTNIGGFAAEIERE